MKITKSKLLKIIKEEMKTLKEAYPPGTPEGLSGEDKLNRGPAAGRGSLEFPEDDEGETGFFYLERGDNKWKDSSPSNAFHPASYDDDPAKFAQRIMKHLDDKGRPLTFNVYNGDPFDVASQNAVWMVKEVPEGSTWPDGSPMENVEGYPGVSSFAPEADEEEDEEHLTDVPPRPEQDIHPFFKEHKQKITKKQLQRIIKEEVLGALK